jgi:hypothetical protein
MPATWTLTAGTETKTLAAWGITGVTMNFVNLGTDTLTFTFNGSPFDRDYPFAYGTIVSLKRDKVQVFYGRVLTLPRYVDGTNEGTAVEVGGPWYDLTNQMFMRRIAGWADAWTPHVVLWWTGGVGLVDAHAMLAEIVQFAIDNGAAIVPGNLMTSADEYFFNAVREVRDITCADAIRQILQVCPDAVGWFDYSITPPAFHVRRHGNLSAGSLPFISGLEATRQVQGLSITPRHDLVKEYVAIIYEITETVDGVAKVRTRKDEFPPRDDEIIPGAVYATIDLQGPSVTTVRAIVETDALDVNSPAFWQDFSQVPANVTGFAVRAVSRTGELELDRYLVPASGGSIPDWMLDPDGDFGFFAEPDVITCLVDYDFADPADGVTLLQVRGQSISARVTATDVPSGEYSTTSSFEEGDPQPIGLAEFIYKAVSQLHYSGSFTLVREECACDVRPGMRVNLTGSRAEFVAMNAMVQQVTEDVDSGTASVTFGPPEHLGPQDLVQRMLDMRTRRRWTRLKSFESGDAGGEEQVIPRLSPAHDATSGPMPMTRHAIYDAAGADKGKFEINAATKTTTLSEAATTARKTNSLAGGNVITDLVGLSGSVLVRTSDCGGQTISIKKTKGCVSGKQRTCYVLRSPFFRDADDPA